MVPLPPPVNPALGCSETRVVYFRKLLFKQEFLYLWMSDCFVSDQNVYTGLRRYTCSLPGMGITQVRWNA